jgi:hypothetical protein
VENSLPVDLTGWYAFMSIKKYITSAESILNLSSDDGQILLDGDGNITIQITSTITSTLPKTNGVYDLVLKDPLMKIYPPLLGGRFFIIPMVATT